MAQTAHAKKIGYEEDTVRTAQTATTSAQNTKIKHVRIGRRKKSADAATPPLHEAGYQRSERGTSVVDPPLEHTLPWYLAALTHPLN